MKTESEARTKNRELSEDITKQRVLTQALADLLIERVILHPDNGIEVVWKIKDFISS
jgi:hypothetical protein